MSAAAMHAAQQHVSITNDQYPNSASSSRQYLQNHQDAEDVRTPQNVYAISSQQSRESRRAHASPSSQRHYEISNNTDDYNQRNINLPSHTRTQPQRDQYDGQPFVPPRTTSARSPGQSSNSRSTRHQETYSTPNGIDGNDRTREDPDSSRSRRRAQQTPENYHNSSTNTRERQYEQSSRSDAAAPQHPEMMRENSEVLNRVLITDPAVDEERMRARIAEAQPMQPTAEAKAMGLTHEQPYTDDTRGPQRRQDYSKSKRREIQFQENEKLRSRGLCIGSFNSECVSVF